MLWCLPENKGLKQRRSELCEKPHNLPFIPAKKRPSLPIGRRGSASFEAKKRKSEAMRDFMPTYIRVAYAQPDGVISRELSAVSIFLIIGLIQLAFAVLAGGQWASFGEQSLW